MTTIQEINQHWLKETKKLNELLEQETDPLYSAIEILQKRISEIREKYKKKYQRLEESDKRMKEILKRGEN